MNATQIKDAVIAAQEYYNRHYINIDENKNVIAGWSDGPHNTRKVTDNDILINDKGGYQFRLVIDGEPTEENPPLFDGMTMIPLYQWDGEKIVRRAEEEINNDRLAYQREQDRLASLPTQLDRIESQITYTALMTDTLIGG